MSVLMKLSSASTEKRSRKSCLVKHLEICRENSSTQLNFAPKPELRRAGKGIRLIVGGGRAAKPDRQMIALLRNAYATRDALMSGRDATIDATGAAARRQARLSVSAHAPHVSRARYRQRPR